MDRKESRPVAAQLGLATRIQAALLAQGAPSRRGRWSPGFVTNQRYERAMAALGEPPLRRTAPRLSRHTVW